MSKRLLASLFVLALLSSTVWLYWNRNHTPLPEAPTEKCIKAFWVRISDDESLEYEWNRKVEPAFYRDKVMYSGYLIRTVDGIPRRYFVSEDEFLPDTLELRANKNGDVWLVQPARDDPDHLGKMRVCGSLDRRTGQFINSYGAVMDWHWSEAKQEGTERPRLDNTGYLKEQPQPKWANSAQSILLAKTGDFVLRNYYN